MAVTHFKELIAWQKAMDLVELVYTQTRGYPREEVYGLTNQTRRAAVSVPSNIAEGQGRRTTRDFLHYLSIAYGSLCELETQILIGQRLDYLNSTSATSVLVLSAEVGRLINGLSKALEASCQ
jgi:four helix bundle protein